MSLIVQKHLVQNTVQFKAYSAVKGRGAAFESGCGDVYAGAEEPLCHHSLVW